MRLKLTTYEILIILDSIDGIKFGDKYLNKTYTDQTYTDQEFNKLEQQIIKKLRRSIEWRDS